EQGKAAMVKTTVLDNGDGVRSIVAHPGSFTPHIAVARDGKVWLPTLDGATYVDPQHVAGNPLPPPVQIEQIVADRKTYDVSGKVALPPLVRDLAIDYTALSLVAPEKMQFRYRLVGGGRGWVDVCDPRQAVYTDLAPA